jgi:hypothetical protein
MADQDQFVTCLVDTEDAFGVTNADDVSALGLPVIKGSIQANFEREALEEDSITQDHGQWAPVEGSAAGSSFNFTTRVGGIGDITVSPNGVEGAEDGETPVRTALGSLLLSLLGEEEIVDGDTVGAAPTVASFDLVTQTTLTTTGPVVLLVETADDGLVPIPVTIDTGTCTCLMQPPSAPVAAGEVWGSLNYQLVEGLDLTKSIQGIFVSDTTGHKFRALGAMVRQLTMNLSAKKLGTAEVQMLVNAWAVVTTALSPIDPPPSRPWMDATFRMAEVGTLTYAAGQMKACKGDLALVLMRGLSPEDDPNHAEGASGYDENFSDALFKFSPILPYETTWRDNFGLNINKAWHVLVASTRQPGRGMALYSTRVVQSGYPKKVEHNGMVRVQPEFALGSGYTQPGMVVSIF